MALHAPTGAEVTEVAQELNLPELAVEDAVIAHQRPKLDIYDDVVFVVLRPVRYADHLESVTVDEIAMFIAPNFVVTVRHGPADLLRQVREELTAGSPLASLGPAAVLYRVADLVVDEHEAVISELDVDVDEIEEQVFGPDDDDHSQRIYRLREEVAQFRRAVLPTVRPLEALVEGRVPNVNPELAEYFRDVLDHVLRASESLEVIAHSLSAVLEANTARVTMAQTRVGLQQNADMRKISAWAAMALVPTMIAGIYGMNFTHMPELNWQYGYPLVISVMVVACVALYRNFRRKGWL